METQAPPTTGVSYPGTEGAGRRQTRVRSLDASERQQLFEPRVQSLLGVESHTASGVSDFEWEVFLFSRATYCA